MTIIVDKNSTVVPQNDYPLVVSVEKATTVTVDGKIPAVVVTGMMGPAGDTSLNLMNDVDLTNLENGSLLVYDTSSSKWKSSKTLESQLINAGFF